MLYSNLIVASALLATTALAVPVANPQVFPSDEYVETLYCPIVDGNEEVAGKPEQIGLSVPGGQTISRSETHSFGTIWTVGGDLGISAKGISVGLSTSVSEIVSDAVSENDAADCPNGNWRCSLLITPSLLRVFGHLHHQGPDDKCGVSRISSTNGGAEGKPFEAHVPIVDSSGNGKWTPDLCTCHNRLGWADPGHPAILCPEDCTPAPR